MAGATVGGVIVVQDAGPFPFNVSTVMQHSYELLELIWKPCCKLLPGVLVPLSTVALMVSVLLEQVTA